MGIFAKKAGLTYKGVSLVGITPYGFIWSELTEKEGIPTKVLWYTDSTMVNKIGIDGIEERWDLAGTTQGKSIEVITNEVITKMLTALEWEIGDLESTFIV